ncbi:DUF427 domain-containing protein [Bacteroidota bacterium]
MKQAIWNDQIIAESDDIVLIDGMYYFPKDTVKMQFLANSEHKTICHWKGEASYYHAHANGKINNNAAFEYKTPCELASSIKDRIAFWKGIKIIDI